MQLKEVIIVVLHRTSRTLYVCITL